MFVATADAAGSGGHRLRRADGRVGRRAGGLRGGVRSRCQTEGGRDRPTSNGGKKSQEKEGGRDGG